MKLRNLGFATIISVLAILSFSSCSSDGGHYRWVEGYLDTKKHTFYTNSAGNVGEGNGFTIDTRDLYSVHRIRDIKDLEFVGNDEVQLDVWSNAFVDDIWLDIEGTNVELHFSDIEGANDFYDGDVNYFVGIVVDQIRRFGYADINVEARSRYKNVQIDITILGDVDIYAED